MKKIILAALILISVNANAQIKKVTLQASGLTCSMCSNAINKSLQSLDFVSKVYANIKKSSFDIFFNPDAKIDFDNIKKKVEDAGFFVAGFSVEMNFNNLEIKNDQHVQYNGVVYHFLKTTDQTLNGDKTIRIIDKGFVSAKEYKKNNTLTKMKCYKTGVAEDCCVQDNLEKGTRIYHVTI